jgi:hypothetical protein
MNLLDGWGKLWRAWTVQLAALGIALPELLQLLADNSSLLPWLDAEVKSAVRLACLVLVIVTRPIAQKSLAKPEK